MIPAANAVDATTIPGPPRAFMATARLSDERTVSPATRAPAKTLAALIAHAATRKPSEEDMLKPCTRSSPSPIIAK